MDRELRLQVLRAIARDSSFLKAAWRDVDVEAFTEPEESVVARAAIDFYDTYAEPVGALLSMNAGELARAEKFGADRLKKLDRLLQEIRTGSIETVSIKALRDKVRALRQSAFYERAVETIIEAYEKKTLDTVVLADIVDRARTELRSDIAPAVDYFAQLKKRMLRRTNAKKKYPAFLIDALDRKIHSIARGQFAIWLAPPASGKGLSLVWMGMSYAIQGYNVLHITLEDPLELVEDRFDAAITGLPLEKLAKLPRRLRRLFRRKIRAMRGRIRIIDGTEGGWTVSMVEKAWEQERQRGFQADVIVVDYDDELVCEKSYKGDSAKRMESAEIYKRLRGLAAKLNVFLWTAAQTGKGAVGKKLITGKDVAEDFSKIRKVFLAIGIGTVKTEPEKKFLYIAKHRTDRAYFAVTIVSDFSRARFYDRHDTFLMEEQMGVGEVEDT